MIKEKSMIGKDLTGKRFGRLTVLKQNGRDKKGYIIWRCKCDCGNECNVISRYLASNGTTSCGCYSREIHSAMLKTHGHSHTRLHKMWSTMIGRCCYPNVHEYENYGGRGVKVCDDWLDYPKFEEWALANGYNPKAKHGACTIDRIDTDKDYTPNNCRWVDMKTQQRNRRNNVRVEYNGETHCLSEWAEIVGIKYVTLYKRFINGWAFENVLYGK